MFPKVLCDREVKFSILNIFEPFASEMQPYVSSHPISSHLIQIGRYTVVIDRYDLSTRTSCIFLPIQVERVKEFHQRSKRWDGSPRVWTSSSIISDYGQTHTLNLTSKIISNISPFFVLSEIVPKKLHSMSNHYSSFLIDVTDCHISCNLSLKQSHHVTSYSQPLFMITPDGRWTPQK